MTNDELLKIVDAFAYAIASGKVQPIELATGDLLMALSDRVAVQSASTVVLLITRQERIEERADNQQRHIEALDVREDETDERLTALEEAATHAQEAGR
jgi:hypothetical protein